MHSPKPIDNLDPVVRQKEGGAEAAPSLGRKRPRMQQSKLMLHCNSSPSSRARQDNPLRPFLPPGGQAVPPNSAHVIDLPQASNHGPPPLPRKPCLKFTACESRRIRTMLFDKLGSAVKLSRTCPRKRAVCGFVRQNVLSIVIACFFSV